MALQLSNFFNSRRYLDDIQNYQLSIPDITTARSAIKYDIDSFIVNGLISYSSSINSLNKRNYSWSFIQSYYSLYYFARAFNGINDYAIVYKDSKPYGIKIQPNEVFNKLRGNSHEVVFTQYKNHFIHDVLNSNDIEGIAPIDWFNKNRNHINYTLNPQTDPKPPLNIFGYDSSLRKWITTYLNDLNHTYTFDPEHCYVSYPLQVFLRIYEYYTENQLKINSIDDERINFFKNNFSDDKGPIPMLLGKIKDLSD